MAWPVILKRSAVPAKVPTTADLALGELGINTFDGEIYIKKDNGTETIVRIGGGGGTVRNWDLTPVSQPASITVWSIPAPYTDVIYNPVGVVGNEYSADWVTIPGGYSMEMSAAILATAPFTGNVAFWWKPMVGGAANTLQFMDATLNATLIMFVHPTLGLHIAAGYPTRNYNAYTDPDFIEGDVVLVQVSSGGAISVKTPNLGTTAIDTITIASGDVIVAFGDMHPTNAPTITGQLAGSDLGSGLTVDAGFVAITTTSPPGLPAGSVNGDLLKVTVPGSYNGVPYSVNEGAAVVDAGNGLVTPMVYESIVQPVAYELLTITVGPAEEHKSLKTLHTELVNKGIFAKYLYIIYRGTTVENSLDIAFPGTMGVVILTDAGLNNVVTNASANVTITGTAGYGILWGGEWHVGTVYARNVRFDASLRLHCSTFDGINIESLSSQTELHASEVNNPAVKIRNLGVLSPDNQTASITLKIFANNGTAAGVVELYGYTAKAQLECTGGMVRLVGGTHHLLYITYQRVSEFFPDPPCITDVTEGAVFSGVLAAPNPNNWTPIPTGLQLTTGVAWAGGVSGDVTNQYSQTPGTATANGIIYGA